MSTATATRTQKVKIARGKIWQGKKAVNIISQLRTTSTAASKHAGETEGYTELLSKATTRTISMCEQGLRT